MQLEEGLLIINKKVHKVLLNLKLQMNQEHLLNNIEDKQLKLSPLNKLLRLKRLLMLPLETMLT